MAVKFDVKVTDRTTQWIKDVERQIQQLPKEAYDYWKKITPIDTGNARRSTSLQGNTIHANYQYAKRLDEGWSNQAKDGMIKPTEKFIEDKIKKILGN